jgi:protein O-mannosyl-transferase
MGQSCSKSVQSSQKASRVWLDSRFHFALLLAAGSLLVAGILYYPALGGAFVFDDLSLPLEGTRSQHVLGGWMFGNRPILILSYGLNARLFGDSPLSYHLVNLLIHVVNAGLVFAILGRLLAMAGWVEKRKLAAAAIGSLVFLIHPLQTESVSYISGRSESLASMFLLLAYSVFLYRRQDAISWKRSLAVLLLFGLGVGTKENAVSLAGILLLTDLMWPAPFSLQGIRNNRRLYLLMVPGAVLAAIGVFRMLATAGTAGFSVGTFKWYEYAFTEARAIFQYIELTLVPIGQALDHDFPASRTVLQHGAILYIGLLAGLIFAAVRWSRRFPLACFGFLMFLTWLAPTSSVVPIDDPVVERRVYLALIGLILIGCEIADRLKPSKPAVYGTVTALALVFCGFCYVRNQQWGKPETLIAFAASDAKYNPRPMLNLAELLIKHNRCDLAVEYLQRAERILPHNYFVNASWGRTLACLGHLEEGMRRLQVAAQIRPCSQVFLWIGLVYGQMGRPEDARKALEQAVRLEPDSAQAHGALALWYESNHDLSAAEREYQTATNLDPQDETVRLNLERVSRMKSLQPSPVPY